jgi:hypothetical protein
MTYARIETLLGAGYETLVQGISLRNVYDDTNKAISNKEVLA